MDQVQIKLISIWITAIIFGCMFIFQMLLAVGAPLGHMAWGGKLKTLPSSLRIASTVSALIFLYGIAVVLESADLIELIHAPKIIQVSVWVFALMFTFSTVGNYLSKSRLEKRIMTPISLILSITCFIIALS